MASDLDFQDFDGLGGLLVGLLLASNALLISKVTTLVSK